MKDRGATGRSKPDPIGRTAGVHQYTEGALTKIANWSIEWMSRWFSLDSEVPELRPSDEIAGVTDIRDLCARAARVIDGLGADVLAIPEGPSRRAQMQIFVSEFLGERYRVVGRSGGGQQKL